MKSKLFFLILLVVPAVTGFSKDIAGVSLPDTLTFEGQSLLLNGVGLRKKFFIKVYAGGLYLKAVKTSAQDILALDEAMAVRMRFIYDGVSSEKLVEAWNEGFEHTANGKFQEEIASFNALFKNEAKKGSIYDVVYIPQKGIDVYFDGQLLGTVPSDAAFKTAVFGIWLGNIPADEGLKEGMLAGKN